MTYPFAKRFNGGNQVDPTLLDAIELGVQECLTELGTAIRPMSVMAKCIDDNKQILSSYDPSILVDAAILVRNGEQLVNDFVMQKVFSLHPTPDTFDERPFDKVIGSMQIQTPFVLLY